MSSGEFNSRTLAGLAFIVFFDCLIELPCIRFIFKTHLSTKRILIFFFGNAVTNFLAILPRIVF